MRVDECVMINEILPQPRFTRAWDSIITDPAVKQRLLHAVLLALPIRPRLPFEVTALHGLFTLYGPPGTGKTTLARGVPGARRPFVRAGGPAHRDQPARADERRARPVAAAGHRAALPSTSRCWPTTGSPRSSCSTRSSRWP